MSNIRFDVLGIGNAIVDVIGRCEDAFSNGTALRRAHAPRGCRHREQPLQSIGSGSRDLRRIGRQHMVGIASLGGRSAFIGKVAGDEFGRIFAHDIRTALVPLRHRAPELRHTDRPSLILVTPDGERTMNTFLASAPNSIAAKSIPNSYRSAAIVYLEGYLFDRPEAKEAFRQAAEIAANAGRKVALTLIRCLLRRPAPGRVPRPHSRRVDILIANEARLPHFTRSPHSRKQPTRADRYAACRSDAERRGIGHLRDRSGPDSHSPAPVDAVVDTTGAGDLYAAASSTD